MIASHVVIQLGGNKAYGSPELQCQRHIRIPAILMHLKYFGTRHLLNSASEKPHMHETGAFGEDLLADLACIRRGSGH